MKGDDVVRSIRHQFYVMDLDRFSKVALGAGLECQSFDDSGVFYYFQKK